MLRRLLIVYSYIFIISVSFILTLSLSNNTSNNLLIKDSNTILDIRKEDVVSNNINEDISTSTSDSNSVTTANLNEINNFKKEEIITTLQDDYIGSIIIPKINLNKYLYDINSSKNNINENVTILKGSILPDDNNNSIIFIAAHSGSGRKAFFKDVKYLENDDIIYIVYKGIKYTYQVFDKKEVSKNGYISGIYNYNNQLILTTCSDTKGKQLIIYGIRK